VIGIIECHEASRVFRPAVNFGGVLDPDQFVDGGMKNEKCLSDLAGCLTRGDFLKVIDEALFNQKITLRKRDRCFTACFDFVEFIGQQMGDVDRV
jgi:hypothetical protein